MSFKDLPGYNAAVLPYHFAQSLVAGARFGFPARRLRVIGVTGTNGKTTTCFMIWKMLNSAGHKTGLMTTVAWGGFSEKDLTKQVEHMTTVDAVTLNRRIKTIADMGAEFLVLEVTSHALAQFRTLGIHFEIAVMTNISHEHLDYHKTLDRYIDAKCKLFRHADFGVVNADDANSARFIAALPHVRGADSTRGDALPRGANYSSYGIKSGEIRAKSLNLRHSGVNYSSHDIKNSKEIAKISTNLPGEFNVYNSLAAVCVGLRLGLSASQISNGIAALKEVEGRMARIDLGQNFDVIVDFAHTPDAFEKVFSSVTEPHEKRKSVASKSDSARTGSSPSKSVGRVISLFGGAGRRDESTRALRGEIAGRYSDICILTEDDSRDENPREIMAQFADGCKKAGLSTDKIIQIDDRAEAIAHAISIAKRGDLVLILGKGHEKTILRADGPHPFEDMKVTAAAIRKRMRK